MPYVEPTPATPTVEIFAAFTQWINQKPRLDFANYGDRRAYASEVRQITKDKHTATKALREAQSYPFNAEAMAQALRGSYSGRLSWVLKNPCKCGLEHCPVHEVGAFDYCTGQYWPTEYRKAAYAVLANYCDAVRPKQLPSENQEFRTMADLKAANAVKGGHWFSRGNMKFARSRVYPSLYHGQRLIWFVSTEKSGFDDRSPRRASVRVFDPKTADVTTCGEYGGYGDIADARAAARDLAKRDRAGEHKQPTKDADRCEFCGTYRTWCTGTATEATK